MITREGEHEHLKAFFHLAGFGIAAICLAYNFARWREDKQWRNAANCAVYGGLIAFEAGNVLHHVESAKHE